MKVLNYTLQYNLIGHTEIVNSAKFSPNGQWLATASDDSTVKMWNVSAGQLMKNIVGHLDSVKDIAWSCDNSLLVSASHDRTAKIWDVQRGRLLMTLEGHTSFVSSCCLNPQTTLVATSSLDGTICTWDVRTGNPVITSKYQDDPISCLTFSKDGTLIVSGNFGGLWSLWETATAKCVKNREGSFAPITNVKLLPNESWLLTVGLDSSIKLWNAEDRALKVFRGHENDVFDIKVDYLVDSTGSIHLVSGSEDTLIYIWNVESQAVEQKIAGNNSAVVCTACHPMEEIIASSALDYVVKVWKNNR